MMIGIPAPGFGQKQIGKHFQLRSCRATVTVDQGERCQLRRGESQHAGARRTR